MAFLDPPAARRLWTPAITGVKEMQRNALYLKPRTVLMLDTVVPAGKDVDVTALYQAGHLKDIQADAKSSRITKDGTAQSVHHLYPESMTVKAEQTPNLAYRSSCRMGVCGSCGMFVNDLPMLACQTQVLHLGTDGVTVAPLPNYPNVKDLVPNLEPLIQKHAAIKPFIIFTNQAEIDEPTGEFLQTPEERESISQFTHCIKCGLCLAACPTVATDPEFLGPQARSPGVLPCGFGGCSPAIGASGASPSEHRLFPLSGRRLRRAGFERAQPGVVDPLCTRAGWRRLHTLRSTGRMPYGLLSPTIAAGEGISICLSER